MSPVELWTFLQAHDVALVVTGDRLRVDAPVGVLTPELRADLTRHKAALVAALAPATEFVCLPGYTVPRPALDLHLDLERRDFCQALDARGLVEIQPEEALTDVDRLLIHRWRRHLAALIAYSANAVLRGSIA